MNDEYIPVNDYHGNPISLTIDGNKVPVYLRRKGKLDMKDQELFELCKKVYELFPFWAGTDMIYGKEQDGDWKIMPLTLSIPKRNRIPLYTSDYLLDKLPKNLSDSLGHWLILMPFDDIKWSAGYLKSARDTDIRYHQYDSDTPLKALLKLTIALHKEGLLS